MCVYNVFRFSLDTRSIDSDGEREDQCQSLSSVEEFSSCGETELTKSIVMHNAQALRSVVLNNKHRHTHSQTPLLFSWSPPQGRRCMPGLRSCRQMRNLKLRRSHGFWKLLHRRHELLEVRAAHTLYLSSNYTTDRRC